MPTCVDDFLIAKPNAKDWLNNCVDGKLSFPSHSTKGFLFYGKYGVGKTLCASALPIMIEYARASDEDKSSHNWCYRYDGEDVSITPNQIELPKFSLDVNFFGCSKFDTNTVRGTINSIEHDMKNICFYHNITKQKHQYFVFDEFDNVKTNHQQEFKSLLTNTHFNNSIFIFTTNFENSIDDGIRDRVMGIEFGSEDLMLYRKILVGCYPYQISKQNDEWLSRAVKDTNGSIRQLSKILEQV